MVGCIVVAPHNEDLDACFPQMVHAGGEVKAGIVVPPIAVINVTGDEDKIYFFLNGKLNEIIKSLAGSIPNVFGSTCIALQAPEWAV